MKQLRIVQVSESEFSVQGHGVHTAFVETVHGLNATDTVEVIKNSLQPADVRHIHTVGPYSLLQLMRPGAKIISAHVVPASFVGSLVGAKYWERLAKVYLRWFYNRAKVVLAVSDTTKAELEAIGVKRRIEVVHNMIDTTRYKTSSANRRKARNELGIPTDKTVVMSNGQVQPRKRVDTFVRLARELPDMHFIWIGGMPFGKVAADATKMQRIIDTAPPNVVFTGVVSLEKVREYFAVGDIFVSTSEQETFGIAIIEAAASGQPIVLRDIHDYDKTFRPEAVMCKEDEFVDELKRLATDSEHYDKMKRNAAKLAKRYDSQVIARQLVDIYRSCLGN
ncbi:glycosyltransferase [Candidatus Saccharibacteria bacterium]|nr:glycosyltransferase [Candidatus Saccharibacteria bacterium]